MKFRRCTHWKKVREPKKLKNYVVLGHAPPEKNQIKDFENAIPCILQGILYDPTVLRT